MTITTQCHTFLLLILYYITKKREKPNDYLFFLKRSGMHFAQEMQIENNFFFTSFIHFVCAIVSLSASSFHSPLLFFISLTYWSRVVDDDHFNNIPFFELILLFGEYGSLSLTIIYSYHYSLKHTNAFLTCLHTK